MKSLIPALIKSRRLFPTIKKDSKNPYFKSKYATLDTVLDAVTPVLCDNGLAIIQTTEVIDNKPSLVTTLWHESGESISSNYPLPEISDSQKFGAAITYARRYSLCALLSITAEEDDDGNAVKTKKTEHQNGKANYQNQRVLAVRNLLDYPVDLVKDWLAQQNVSSPSELDRNQCEQLIEAICTAWASGLGVQPNTAKDKYLNQVVLGKKRGVPEIEAIKSWMRGLSESSKV